MTQSRPSPDDPLPTPFTVVIDTREKTPFAFTRLRADACDQYRPLVVATEVRGLPQGDYSLAGMEHQIAIERKSLSDLYSTLGQRRRQFENELERLAMLRWAAVVVEADWREILFAPPERSQLPPKIVYRSVIAWQQRYPHVHWWPCCDRRLAEIATFRLLERWWKDHT